MSESDQQPGDANGRHPGTSRRGFLTVAGALAVGGLAAACGGQASGAGSPSGVAPTMASGTGSAAESAGFPVTLPGTPGPLTMPTKPQRVVTVGYLRDTDLALALGAPLVGAVGSSAFDGGLAPWQKLPSSVTLIPGSPQTPFEKIAALRPDLIMASDDYSLDKDFATLSRLAPTLANRTGTNTDKWQDMTTRAGRVLGTEAAAARLIAAREAEITAAHRAHPELVGKTYSFGPVQDANSFYTTIADTDSSSPFFGQLGMRLSPTVKKIPPTSTPGRGLVSMERVDLLDADVMILTYATPQARQQVESNPIFRRVPAVRAGRYVALDLPIAIALGWPSVLTIPYALSTVLPKISAAVKKL